MNICNTAVRAEVQTFKWRQMNPSLLPETQSRELSAKQSLFPYLAGLCLSKWGCFGHVVLTLEMLHLGLLFRRRCFGHNPSRHQALAWEDRSLSQALVNFRWLCCCSRSRWEWGHQFMNSERSCLIGWTKNCSLIGTNTTLHLHAILPLFLALSLLGWSPSFQIKVMTPSWAEWCFNRAEWCFNS